MAVAPVTVKSPLGSEVPGVTAIRPSTGCSGSGAASKVRDVISEWVTGFSLESSSESFSPSSPGVPSEEPSELPAGVPLEEPSELPAGVPSEEPSELPAGVPSEEPSELPAGVPSEEPSEPPAGVPSEEPSEPPAGVPSEEPSDFPAGVPSGVPSEGVPLLASSLLCTAAVCGSTSAADTGSRLGSSMASVRNRARNRVAVFDISVRLLINFPPAGSGNVMALTVKAFAALLPYHAKRAAQMCCSDGIYRIQSVLIGNNLPDEIS